MRLRRAAELRHVARDVVRALWLRRRYAKSTMIHYPSYIANLMLAGRALRNRRLRSAAIVECGTWKGGMAAALIHFGGSARDYLFFDSFEGLPPAQELDGEKARAWQTNDQSPSYYENCSASLDDFKATIARARPDLRRVAIHKGFFSDTLPAVKVPPIAILRLDGDWYESTMQCLEKFWDSVIPGGLILIDDYYTWDGCSRAFHDFLSSRKATEKVRQPRFGCVGYIIKEVPDSSLTAKDPVGINVGDGDLSTDADLRL